MSVPRSHGFIESSHVDQTHSAPRRTCRPLEGRVARQQTREAPDCRRRRIARRAYLRCSHPCDWSSDRRARTVSGRNARSDTHQRPTEPRCVLVSRQRSRLRIEWIPQKQGKAGRYGPRRLHGIRVPVLSFLLRIVFVHLRTLPCISTTCCCLSAACQRSDCSGPGRPSKSLPWGRCGAWPR